jgi:hypothetical protein
MSHREVDDYVTACGAGRYKLEIHTAKTIPPARKEQLATLIRENAGDSADTCLNEKEVLENIKDDDPDIHIVLMIAGDLIVGYLDYMWLSTEDGTKVMYIMYICNVPTVRRKNISILLQCKAFLHSIENGCTLLVAQSNATSSKILVCKFDFTFRESLNYDDSYGKISRAISKEFNCYYDLRTAGNTDKLITAIRGLLTEANCRLKEPAVGGSRCKTLRKAGLRALAKKHPYAKHVGFKWIAPGSRGKGIRWTQKNLATFRALQKEYQK